MGKINHVQIRLAELSDIGQLQKLYTDFFAYNARLQPKYYKNGTVAEEYPKSVISSEGEDIFVAADNDRIVGFIHIQQHQTPPYMSYVPYKYAEIIEFFVAAEYRRHGVGSKLFDFVRMWGNERELAYIEAMVLADAKGEMQFYNQKAFDTKAHIMRCDLS